LYQGNVVRLAQGDRNRQTVYSNDPGDTARRWLAAGAEWLHVVNLDGAFGKQDGQNHTALLDILQAAAQFNARVQLGGGLRTLEDMRRAFEMGVSRLILGTIVIEEPEVFGQALELYGQDQIAAALDARDGIVQTRGWLQDSALPAGFLAAHLNEIGLRWLIFTDIHRDGLGSGLNIAATARLQQDTGLNVVASGGLNGMEDIIACRTAGLSGAILGRALYEGKIDLAQALQETGNGTHVS